MENKRVGVEAGGYPSILLRRYETVEIEKIHDWETSFKALRVGDLDAIIVDRWIGEYELANSGVSDIYIVDTPIEIQYSRIAVRKGDTETLALINSGLKEITDDGTVDKIMEAWQGKRVIYLTEDYFQIFYLCSAIIFLLLVTFVAIYFMKKYQKLSKKLEVSIKDRTEELHQTNKMLKAANLKLERISMIDGLTSIENRRAFDIVYNKTWEICLRENMPLALIMVDIDNFKLFNDTYGHLAGDQILIRIAEVIKNVIKTFEDYEFEDIQIPKSISIDELKTGAFIDKLENLILYGPVGTGKSHMATAIGVAACSSGKKVKFYRTAALVNLLSEAKAKGELQRFMKQLRKTDLLICDEWGYVPFEKDGSQLLFQVISECYEKRSVIITTNLEFSKWNGIFYDEKLTSAIIDRLVHHSHLLVFQGQSYRLTHSTMKSQ